MAPTQAHDPDRHRATLDELVARCIELIERGDREGADALLAARPDLGDDARAQLSALRRRGLLGEGAADGAASATPGKRIGAYEILEPLGSGGMGEVFLAQQREPVARRVALKLVRVGMQSPELLARFAVEREALALMTHPNIAAVLDAGTTSDGRPYFAMEYVPGVPINAYCDQHQLAPRVRIDLFLLVCDAVQHAHHKGVIHRDLKPSNVLVTEVDGRPVPKIIDFGVAKTVAQALSAAPAHTQLGSMLGTPEYMSPEQAARGQLDVDTRADVYSLGVILYELLTGALPFESQRLRSSSYEEMLGILRSEEPPRPSTRVTPGTEHARQQAERRGTDAGSLYRRLRGDLDWIVLKALAKDRNRRYSTASELAADIGRALRNEPVTARAPSTSYRLSKFVRRYRVQVAAAALAVAGLVVALVVTLGSYRAARRSGEAASAARAVTDRARAEAQDELAQAISVIDEMLSQVAATSLDRLPQAAGVRRQMLTGALGFYERLLRDGGDDPGLRLHRAWARCGMAEVQCLLGQARPALELAEAAAAELEALCGAGVAAPEVEANLGRAYRVLGEGLVRAGRDALAAGAFTHSLEAIERGQTSGEAAPVELSDAMRAFASLLAEGPRIEALRRAAAQQGLAQDSARVAGLRTRVLLALATLQSGADVAREVLEVQRAVLALGDDPRAQRMAPDLQFAWTYLGATQLATGRADLAASALAAAVQWAQQRVAQDQAIDKKLAAARTETVDLLRLLACAQWQQRDTAASIDSARQAVALAESLAADSTAPAARRALARSLLACAGRLGRERAGDPEAEEFARRAAEVSAGLPAVDR